MIISGTMKEVRTILERAIVTGANYINFVAPNHVLIFHHTNNEYTYLKTTLFISHSLMLTKESVQNLRKFIRRAWGGRNRNPNSPFYRMLGESIAVKQDEIVFDNDDDFSFDFETGLTLLENVTPIHEKLEHFSSSKIEVDKPFLKIKPSIVSDIYKRFTPHGKETLVKNTHINLNEFHINEEYNLIFERLDKMNGFHYLTDKEEEQEFGIDFTVYREFAECRFPLYDVDVVFMQQLSKTRPVDNIVIIPFEDFYILEAHADEVICKIHMKTTYFNKMV